MNEMVLPCPEPGCEEPAEGIGRWEYRCMNDHEFRWMRCPECRAPTPIPSDGLWICTGQDAHHAAAQP